MKRFLMSVAALGICATTAAIAQPKMEIVGGNTYNWGNVNAKQTPLQATVKIVNKGNELLNVTGVKPGCGCTAAPIDKDKLNPGDTATVKVSLNVGASSGEITKSITITSNDPAASTVIYSLKANIIRAVQILPSQYFVFTGMTVGQKSSASVNIKNNSDQEITLSDFEANNGLSIDWNGTKKLKAGEQAQVNATFTPEKGGYFNGTVRMKTSHPDFPSLEIMAYGNVEGPKNANQPNTTPVASPSPTIINANSKAPAPVMVTTPASEPAKDAKKTKSTKTTKKSKD